MSLKNWFFGDAKKKTVLSWALFDFGNSAYTLLILSFVFPIFYKDVIAGATPYADFYWGLIGSLSIFIAGIMAPFVGAIADYDLQRKRRFMIFTIISVIGTALLFFTGSGTILFASIIFIIGNTFFGLATFMNDSLLHQVSTKKTSGRISGLGYGLGYIGGLIAMFLLRPLYVGGYEGSLELLYRFTFPLAALYFLIFSIPSFIYIKDRKFEGKRETYIQVFKSGIKSTFQTMKNVRRHKSIGLFLIAFFFLNDALVTVFAFISIYATTTLMLNITQIFIILFIVQIVAFPAAIIFGLLSDKFGPKKILLITVLTWIFIILLLIFGRSMADYYLVAVLTGLVIGGSQSVGRSWYSQIIPPSKGSEFFGFSAFGSKISSIIGPILFGLISSTTGNQRIAMASLIPFFVISFFIFLKVKEKKS